MRGAQRAKASQVSSAGAVGTTGTLPGDGRGRRGGREAVGLDDVAVVVMAATDGSGVTDDGAGLCSTLSAVVGGVSVVATVSAGVAGAAGVVSTVACSVEARGGSEWRTLVAGDAVATGVCVVDGVACRSAAMKASRHDCGKRCVPRRST